MANGNHPKPLQPKPASKGRKAAAGQARTTMGLRTASTTDRSTEIGNEVFIPLPSPWKPRWHPEADRLAAPAHPSPCPLPARGERVG